MEERNEFNPELHLERDEVAMLGALMAHPGFRVFQKLCKTYVDVFALDMINADQANEKDVLAKHNAAKTAAQFYTMITNRINQEVNDYIVNARESEKPVDAGAGLDMGEFSVDSEEETQDAR